jgi:flagellar hook assembly protein FlgD
VVPASARPEMTPVNLDLNPPKAYPNLSVEINQTQLGFLTVRVVDPQGVQVTVLYKGNLAPGRWMFEWDGKLADGGPATPGFYQIEVRSGGTVQQKSIQIQKRVP